MTDTYPNLGLVGGFAAHEDGWGDAMNLNLLGLSVLTQGAVKSKVSALPPTPTEDDVHILDETVTGGNANKIAAYTGGAWTYFTPKEGWLVYNQAANYFEKFDGSVWAEFETGGGGGSGLPDGGTTGQVLAKASDDDQDVEWVDAGGGGSAGGALTWEVIETGTGSSQDIEIPYPGLNEFNILVFKNGLRLSTSTYALAGTTVTLTVDADDEIAIVGPIGELPPGYKNWRLTVTTSNGGALCGLAEWKFFDGITELEPTISDTSAKSVFVDPTYAAIKAFDDNLSSYAYSETGADAAGGWWIRVDYVDTINPTSYTIDRGNGDTANYLPQAWVVEYYDEVTSSWVVWSTVSGQTGWANNTPREFFPD